MACLDKGLDQRVEGNKNNLVFSAYLVFYSHILLSYFILIIKFTHILPSRFYINCCKIKFEFNYLEFLDQFQVHEGSGGWFSPSASYHQISHVLVDGHLGVEGFSVACFLKLSLKVSLMFSSSFSSINVVASHLVYESGLSIWLLPEYIVFIWNNF